MADQKNYNLQETFDQRRERYAKKETWAKRIATPFVALTTTALSLTGTVALHLLQPGIPFFVLVIMFASGLFVDALMYWREVRETFALFWGRGLFRDLHDYLIEEYMLKEVQALILDGSNNNQALITTENLNILRHELNKIATKRNKKNKAGNSSFIKDAQANVDCLIAEKQERLLRKHIRDMITQWRVDKSANEDGDMRSRGAKYIKNTVINAVNRDYRIKQGLSIFGVIVGAISGFAFGCLVFMHILELAFPGVMLIGGIVAAVVGLSFGKLMFRTLYKMVKNNVGRQILEKVGCLEPRHRTTPYKSVDEQSEHNTQTKKNASSAKKQSLSFLDTFAEQYPTTTKVLLTIARLIPTLLIVALGLTATILLASSLLESSVAFLSLFFQSGAPQELILATQILLLGILLPVKGIFAIYHSLSAVQQIGQGISTRIEWLRDDNTSWEEYKADLKKNPALVVFDVSVKLVMVALSMFHFVAEAAFGGGEGAGAENSWPSHVFQQISAFFGAKPEDAGLAVGTVSESLEHGDFILKEGKGIADAISESISERYECLAKLEHTHTTSEYMNDIFENPLRLFSYSIAGAGLFGKQISSCFGCCEPSKTPECYQKLNQSSDSDGQKDSDSKDEKPSPPTCFFQKKNDPQNTPKMERKHHGCCH